VNPSRLRVGWIGKRGTFTKVPIGWVRASDNETVLGLLSRGQPEPKFEFTAQVSFPEASLLEDMPVILALNYFADIADAIIKAFDF
jgi:hypothetical protein